MKGLQMNRRLLLLLSYFPRPLPVGMAELKTFADRIILQSGEFADKDSMTFALCSNIMHLGAQQAYVSDQFFIRSLRKAAANQVASYFFQEIKLKQQEAARVAAEEAAKPQPVEDTAPTTDVSTNEKSGI